MIRRPPRSTRTDTSFPTRRSSDLTAHVPVIGDIELFAEAAAELPAHRVAGITGTNGKSTVTALVTHMLESAGIPALMGGNIGLPILARDPLPEGRSEERRVGRECVSTCGSRCATITYKTK